MGNENITLETLARRKEGAQPDSAPAPADMSAQPAQAMPKEISPEMRKQVDQIKNGIDLLDATGLITYGSGAQRNMTSFSDNILQKVRGKDAGHVGETLSDLMVAVKSLEVDKIGQKDNSFLAKLGLGNSVKKFMARYETVELQIDKIEAELEKAQTMLLKDITMYDQLYAKNLEYFHELDAYILAGDEKIKEAREEILPKLEAEASASDNEMAPQLVADFSSSLDRFERKVHDLKLSKTIAMQTAPQVRLIQNNDKLLVDKIQSSILHTIPLWKNQVVIALGLQNQQKVLEMQKRISDTTNDLLLKNAELLKQNTVGVARESQRGVVEIETLKKVNEDLVETIEETLKINDNGRQARQAAELELSRIEQNLKDTMLRNMTAN